MDLTWCADGTASGNECVSVMNDCETDKAWSKLLKRKGDVPQAGLKFMDELVGIGKGSPAFFRMDRASENKKMAELIKRKCPEIKTE